MGRRWKILLIMLAVIVLVPVGALALFYQQNLARVEGEYFDSNGVKIHYSMQGEGEPVILVHGFGFNADLNWRGPGIIDALDDTYKVIAIDNRGHGLSGKPHDPAQYGENMPKDIVNLMDHLGIEKAHVVGYSMGGYITLKLLSMHPERLLSAAPCGMGWSEMTEENRALIDRIATSLENGQGFGPLLERLNIDPDGRGIMNNIFNRMLSRTNDEMALAKAMRGMEGLVVPEEKIRENQVPTLTVVGDIDPLAETCDHQHEIMKNHELVYLKGADHVTALRHADYIPALLKFLQAHPAGSWAYAPVEKNAEAAPAEPAALPDAA